MRRYLLYIGILFSALSCGEEATRLQSGDLLFQAGKDSGMAGAIAAATGNGSDKGGLPDFTHVGIAVCGGGADSVLEAAAGGVRIVPLEEFLADAGTIEGRPAVVVLRLRDTTGVAAAVRRARGSLGLPYDFSFRPGNGKLYCSELVWESYRDADGQPLFPARPMNFRAADGTLPRYWSELFARLGEPVPEGVPGTNPNDLAREERLREVFRYF